MFLKCSTRSNSSKHLYHRQQQQKQQRLEIGLSANEIRNYNSHSKNIRGYSSSYCMKTLDTASKGNVDKMY